MLLTTIVRVAFHLPDEYEAMERFKLCNDLNKWEVVEDTNYTTFIRTEHSTYTEVKL